MGWIPAAALAVGHADIFASTSNHIPILLRRIEYLDGHGHFLHVLIGRHQLHVE